MFKTSTLFAVAVVLAASSVTAQNGGGKPPLVTRGEPGPGHRALEPLVGDWDVTMTLFAAMGSPEKPYTVQLRTHREWIGGGRYLRDVSEGPDYFRQGTLGYSNMDRRYEWVTQDGINANMMIYLGRPGSGTAQPITMSGSFTDQGVLGEATVGKRVGQRTVITIQDPNHHRFDLYMTPPGGKERLVDRKVYVRHQ
jgi:uncharacterized protein DUF1579